MPSGVWLTASLVDPTVDPTITIPPINLPDITLPDITL